MKRQNLLTLFEPDTQPHRVVKHILRVGYIFNHEFHGMGILSHTKITSVIREKIKPDFSLDCSRVFIPTGQGKVKGTGTFINRIVEV